MERVFLAKTLPKRFDSSREMLDIYFPKSAEHPTLRIRKNGERFELTKKQEVDAGDCSVRREQTINISEAEFNELEAGIEGKRIHKQRKTLNYKGLVAEFDVFLGPLRGLVLVDFEFKTEAHKQIFEMPDFCLAEVTQDKTFAGGMLCGKGLADIKPRLQEYGYNELHY
jgi:adenylate cyclase